MPTEPTPLILSDLVRRAAAIVDPPGEDPSVEEFAVRYEDADEPVRGELDGLEGRVRGGAGGAARIVRAQGVTLCLAPRRDDFDNTPDHILLHAARAEFDS